MRSVLFSSIVALLFAFSAAATDGAGHAFRVRSSLPSTDKSVGVPSKSAVLTAQATPSAAPVAELTPSMAPTSSRVKIPTSKMTTHQQALAGSAVLWAADVVFRRSFRANKISFPSQLGGCIILFFSLLFLEIAKGGSGDAIFRFLEPSAFFLAKWLPVFFVPGLAMLPLAPSVGTGLDVSVELLSREFLCATGPTLFFFF